MYCQSTSPMVRYMTMEGDLELDAGREPREGRWKDVIYIVHHLTRASGN